MHKYEASPNSFTAAVIGARGYSGMELCRLLLSHPSAKLVAVAATDTAFSLADVLPDEAAAGVRTVLPKDARADIVFLATPAETSAELAPHFLAQGCHVIDLSGAFRLKDPATFKAAYGFEHPAPELLAQAQYGLVPFVGPAVTGKPALIANPGCYATAVLMALRPLLAAGVILPETLVIDAKSGATGAGKKAAENLLYTEVDGECLPYRIGRHQHLPEIVEHCGAQIDPHFSTSLLPIRRGIIAGLYARVRKGVKLEDVATAYQAAYASYPLVRHGRAEQVKHLLSLKRVAGTARTQIGYELSGDKLYVHSLIDNLMKGAASQALENAHRLRDLPVATSLQHKEGVL